MFCNYLYLLLLFVFRDNSCVHLLLFNLMLYYFSKYFYSRVLFGNFSHLDCQSCLEAEMSCCACGDCNVGRFLVEEDGGEDVQNLKKSLQTVCHQQCHRVVRI